MSSGCLAAEGRAGSGFKACQLWLCAGEGGGDLNPALEFKAAALQRRTCRMRRVVLRLSGLKAGKTECPERERQKWFPYLVWILARPIMIMTDGLSYPRGICMDDKTGLGASQGHLGLFPFRDMKAKGILADVLRSRNQNQTTRRRAELQKDKEHGRGYDRRGTEQSKAFAQYCIVAMWKGKEGTSKRVAIKEHQGAEGLQVDVASARGRFRDSRQNRVSVGRDSYEKWSMAKSKKSENKCEKERQEVEK
ncbi:hypothetical protein B0H13DRAFT_1891129 [Mycena leptocephala]|nr:hypothetical protein B0H13DRAFT_1891129 [Mycena leptocephala]